MPADPVKLAFALAERLAAIVPAEIDHSQVLLDLGWLLEGGEDGSTCSAVEWALDHVQDHVAHMTTEPWPVSSPTPMPLPFAAIRDGCVFAGYGDPARPALALAPIPLREVS